MLIMEEKKIQGFSEKGYYLQKTGGRRLSNNAHTHTFYEFLYIVKGSCVHEINKEHERLRSGDLVFLCPGISHRFLSQSEDADVIALSVVTGEINRFLSLYEIHDLPSSFSVIRLSPESRQTLLSICENVVFTNDSRYIMKMRMILNQMLLFCMEPASEKAHIPLYFSEAINKMQDISLFSEGISAFLRISGYSHSQLCRLTKKYLGVTPGEYINKLRINHAYKLIVYSDMDYETICNTIGFESFSHFCKLIKKGFGCSPSKLRNRSKDIRKTV